MKRKKKLKNIALRKIITYSKMNISVIKYFLHPFLFDVFAQ